MGQYWHIFNFDLREKWSHPVDGGLGKLGEFFWDSGEGLARLFTLPTCADVPCPFAGWSVTEKELDAESKTHPTDRPIILRLPVELIEQIFDELEFVETQIVFCLTHPRLGAICEPKVNDSFVEAFAPWVNTSVACVGDYADDEDYPIQIQRYLAQKGPGDASLYRFMRRTYTETETLPELRRQLSYIFLFNLPLTEFTDNDRMKHDKLFMGLYGMRPPPREETVLCNISKGEYVRGDAAEESLGTVILSKICWSSDPSCSMRCDAGRLTRGPWAGDRFVIVPRARMVEGSRWREARVWRDVTEEAVAWVKELRDSDQSGRW